jgi:2-methylcitrate dehydratase PrpD
MGPVVSGATFLTAVAVGMEVGARIGAAGGPPTHRYSPQPGEPPNIRSGRLPAEEFAAAAACAKLLALTPDSVRHAFGAAGANAPRHASRWGVMPTLPDQKYQDYGVVAMTGAMAALLAASGVATHPGILDGPWGLWRLYGAPSCDFDLMLRGLGERWLFLDTAYKPWPSCRWTHHGLTLFERLRDAHDLEADEIQRVILSPHVYAVAPYFRNTRPRGMVSCEFNHPHALAMAALRVPPGPSWYEPQVQEDPRVAAFRERVEVEAEPADSDIERWFVDGQVRRLPTRLRILARGRQFEAVGDYARGDPFGPETILTDDQLIQKVRDMAAGSSPDDAIATQAVESIADCVWQLESTPSIEQLFSLVAFNRYGTQKTPE